MPGRGSPAAQRSVGPGRGRSLARAPRSRVAARSLLAVLELGMIDGDVDRAYKAIGDPMAAAGVGYGRGAGRGQLTQAERPPLAVQRPVRS